MDLDMEHLKARQDIAAALHWNVRLNMQEAPITNDRFWKATTPDLFTLRTAAKGRELTSEK